MGLQIQSPSFKKEEGIVYNSSNSRSVPHCYQRCFSDKTASFHVSEYQANTYVGGVNDAAMKTCVDNTTAMLEPPVDYSKSRPASMSANCGMDREMPAAGDRCTSTGIVTHNDCNSDGEVFLESFFKRLLQKLFE